jgi:hypothetical protein
MYSAAPTPSETRTTDTAKLGMTMQPRIVKTEAQYRRYLDEVARLAANSRDWLAFGKFVPCSRT